MVVKLEFMLFGEVYVAGLISIRKKNSHPLIYTDLNGNIIATNRKAQERLGFKNSYAKSEASIFSMFPKLIYTYFPLVNPSRRQSDDQSKSITVDKTGYQRSETIDVLFFKMLIENHDKLVFENPKANMKDRLVPVKIEINFEQEELTKLVQNLSLHKKLIIDHLSKVYMTKLNIETNVYQQDVEMKEVSLTSLSKIPLKLRQFIRFYFKCARSQLSDILLMSPEGLSGLSQICEYQINLKHGKANELFSQKPTHEHSDIVANASTWNHDFQNEEDTSIRKDNETSRGRSQHSQQKSKRW